MRFLRDEWARKAAVAVGLCVCCSMALQIEIEGQGYVVTRLELTFKVR
jgi:hypothetical protein